MAPVSIVCARCGGPTLLVLDAEGCMPPCADCGHPDPLGGEPTPCGLCGGTGYRMYHSGDGTPLGSLSCWDSPTEDGCRGLGYHTCFGYEDTHAEVCALAKAGNAEARRLLADYYEEATT